VAYAVEKQSKVVAALAQLGNIQERGDMRQAIAKKAVAVDKKWFQLGVLNVGITSYLLGAFPALYYLYYTPKVLSLILLRLVKFYAKKQHFLLWDYCYWANFLCIFFCWVRPDSPEMFRIVFMCANGPLAWSVLAFNHALIFHSYAHITSVVVHVSPLVLTYGLRWYAAPMSSAMGAEHFRICEGGPEDCLATTPQALIWQALTRFYLWWSVLYYLWIFVVLGSYIERKSYQAEEPRQPRTGGELPVYLLIHLAFSIATMGVASVLWYSQLAHFGFLLAICASTVRNAAEFYFEVFETQYAAAPDANPQHVALSKKLKGASAAFAQIQENTRRAAQ
jgi:hypothetical protein